MGLTGAIGSGKTEALRAFAEAGAATISTDEIVHQLLSTAPVRDELVDRWGQEVAPEGQIDRAVVASKVFEAPEELRWLESVLHPRVGAEMVAWRTNLPESTALGVVEVPLLFESGMEAAFDATAAVVADDAARRERAAGRGHEGVEARDARQLSQQEKADRATYVIQNEGDLEDLHREVANLVARLTSVS